MACTCKRLTTTQLVFQVLIVVALVSPALSVGCHCLWVQLLSWTGNGNDHLGNQCDSWIAGKACDPRFYICVDYKTPEDGTYANMWTGTRMLSCGYSRKPLATQKYRNRDSVSFPTGAGVLGGSYSVSNPLRFDTINRPWQQARVYVRIEDHDRAPADDFVDEHMFTLPGARIGGTYGWAYPYTSVTPPAWIRSTDSGRYWHNTASRMTLQYKAVCCRNYYGRNCSVYCEEQNSASYGYYNCNRLTGAKICRRGYTNPHTSPPCVTRIPGIILEYNGTGFRLWPTP